MPKNKLILVRVNKNQHERVKVNAYAKGFKTISSYIRSLALERDLSFEKKFNEMYEEIVTNGKGDKKKEERPLTKFI